MTRPRPLDESPAARRRALERASAIALRWFEDARDIPVVHPVDASGLHDAVDAPLPEAGEPLEDTLAAFEDVIAPACRNNGHPRMFGYVSAPSAFAGVAADLVASAINQNVTSWRSAPGPTEVERTVVRWIAEAVNYPRDAGGLLLSGGSMANFTALAAALRKHARDAGVDLDADGVAALPQRPVVYASGMTHMSIAKAASMLGLGRHAVRLVREREDFTLDVEALRAAVREDREAGRWPFCVVANAGDVNTGAVDDLNAIADACSDLGLWLHVDGAYGGFAAMAPSARERFDGLARADSVSLDPHKWLFAPLDTGCVLVKDASALHAAFAGGAEYVQVLARPFTTSERDGSAGSVAAEGARERFAFWDYGPELSRRFRALKVWMILRHHGTRALGAVIDENVRLGARLAALVDDADDFERLAPAPLSIVCFRHVPRELQDELASGDARARERAEEKLNALNREIVARVQRGGDAYLSNAMLRGRFALRACIVNHRTREEDLPMLLDAARDAAASVRDA